MTADRDVTRIVRSWLEDGATRLPDHVLDRVLDDLPATPQHRPWWSVRRVPRMNSTLKMVLAAAAVVAVAVGGIYALSPQGGSGIGSAPTASPSPVASPSPAVSPSPSPSPSSRAVDLTVRGTEDQATPAVRLTAVLPPGWRNAPYAVDNGAQPTTGVMVFASVIDNTFSDPCVHIPRTPKVGSTVDAWVTALGDIPNTTATAPVQTTIAGREATYIELTTPASLPCAPDLFYLWQDQPGSIWHGSPDEETRVWILEVGGRPVAISAQLGLGTTSNEVGTELQRVLDSIVFEGGS